MKAKLFDILLIAVVTLTLAAAARAETFSAYLNSAQEVPSNASTATGYARVVLNESAGTITFTVVFNNLSSTQTASHIHAPGAIGVSTAVAINFGAVGGTSGTISGTAAITPTQLAQIRAHLGYVNVHSSNFPGGEIRGQLGNRRPVDFDGDGRTDMSVLRFPNVAAPGVAQITYWNMNSTGGLQNGQWGDANLDFPAPGDYDGDGRDDLAMYRTGANPGEQSYFFIFRSSNSTTLITPWGLNGDRQVNRDYDGDGKTDLAIFRPGATAGTQAYWWIIPSSTGINRVIPWGTTGDGTNTLDVPVPGDYDGDGKFDLAVYRVGIAPANTFLILRSSDGGVIYQQWGNFTTDYIVPGDYDGDGKFDFAAARTGALASSPMVWWILQSSNISQARVQTFGISSDLPTQGDYDGDARTDIAIYRRGTTAISNNNYWIYRSLDNAAQVTTWGLQPDFPVNTFDAR